MSLTRNIILAAVSFLCGTLFVFADNLYIKARELSEESRTKKNFNQKLPIIQNFQKEQNCEVILSAKENKGITEIPLQLKITIRNNSSERCYVGDAPLPFEEVQIKDSKGLIIKKNKEKKSPPKVSERSHQFFDIEPGKEFTYFVNIADEYKLSSSKTYEFTVKRKIISADFKKNIEVTSKPLKIIFGEE